MKRILNLLASFLFAVAGCTALGLPPIGGQTAVPAANAIQLSPLGRAQAAVIESNAYVKLGYETVGARVRVRAMGPATAIQILSALDKASLYLDTAERMLKTNPDKPEATADTLAQVTLLLEAIERELRAKESK